MSAELNKIMMRRWFEEGWAGNLALADDIFAPEFTLSGKVAGPAGPKQNVAFTRSAFPDARVSVEDQLIAGEDVVITRYIARGTHTGDFMGIAPTGRPIEVGGIVIWRFAEGKAIEDWTQFDLFGLLRQIGAKVSA